MSISLKLSIDYLSKIIFLSGVFALLLISSVACGEKESLGETCTPSFKSQHPSEIHIENGPGYNCDTWYCLSVANNSGKRFNYCTQTCENDNECSSAGMICRNLHYNGDYANQQFCIRPADFSSEL